jgi:4a-hydroxytetrahydrobiopterin dehydratase
MTVLSDIEIQREISTLPGWSRKGNEITKTFTFDGFPAAIAFVQSLVPIAEGMNHHPDIDIRYDRVTIRLSSHDSGGVTGRDIRFAKTLHELGE